MWLFVFAAAGTVKDPTTNPGIGKCTYAFLSTTIPLLIWCYFSFCYVFSFVVMIVSACMFILGYAMSWAPGVWILVGETFPTRTRAKQGALATSANWCVVYFIFGRSSAKSL